MMQSFEDFILEHENADTAQLLLSKKAADGIDISLAVNTIEVRKKFRKKIPAWYALPALAYPSKLSAEQCSSEKTAMYKAGIVRRLFPQGACTVADLTGGLGVDSWAFSKVASKVIYNEMNPALAATVSENFRKLGADNIEVNSCELVPESTVTHDNKKSARVILSSVQPDVIFLDPARRGEGGRKVFLLEDCSPDVLSLKDELLGLSRYLLIKLSPIADISMIIKRLGPECAEIHILEAERECKEVIVLLDREWKGRGTENKCSIIVSAGDKPLIFSMEDLSERNSLKLGSPDELRTGATIFEPGKALMKAGVFNSLSLRFGMKKLAKSTHYYLMDDSSDSLEKGLTDKGKFFIIKEIHKLNKKTVKEVGKAWPKSEVTARNLKMNTDSLRTKLGLKSGGKASEAETGTHILGLHCEFPSGAEDFLLVTSPANSQIDKKEVPATGMLDQESKTGKMSR